jgi:hypothetical protein
MRDIAELHINEGGLPVTRSAPSAEVIAAFEQEFGITIPAELIALLRHSNGGHPELDLYSPPTCDSDYKWAVNHFHFLDEDKGAIEGMWRTTAEWRHILGAHALPFANTGGGDEFFLDLSQTPARVGVTVHDENFRVVWLARSLEAFLAGLVLDPDAI